MDLDGLCPRFNTQWDNILLLDFLFSTSKAFEANIATFVCFQRTHLLTLPRVLMIHLHFTKFQNVHKFPDHPFRSILNICGSGIYN